MRIGITQRVDHIEQYNERRDCLDQKWQYLMHLCNLTVLPIPNINVDIISWIELFDIQGFILSGGNDLTSLPEAVNIAPERDHTERQILQYAEKCKLPLLGVCRGFQMMNSYYDGNIKKVSNHIRSRHKIIIVSEHEAFGNYMTVNSYHGWGFSEADMSDQFNIAALSSVDNTVEACIHKTLPWIGIMWHPEREDSYCAEDIKLIKYLFHETN